MRLTEPILAGVRQKLRYDLSDETFLLNFAAWKDDSLSESYFSSLKPTLCVRTIFPQQRQLKDGWLSLVEGTGFENRRWGNLSGGSNPSPSAHKKKPRESISRGFFRY